MDKDILKFLDEHPNLIFTFEGLIGSGKSTICKSIVKYLDKSKSIYEPVYPKLLDMYYKNPKKYAFNFQSIIVRERMWIYNDTMRSSLPYLYNIDRSIIGDLAFALMHIKKDNFTPEEIDVYLELLDNINTKQNITRKNYIIYLNCSPEKCRNRLIKRNNNQEIKNCSIEYLHDLELAYKSILYNENNGLSDALKHYKYEKLIEIPYEPDDNMVNDTLSEEYTSKVLKMIIDQI